jgi:hypothetical protein
MEELQTNPIQFRDLSQFNDFKKLNQHLYYFLIAFFYHQVKGDVKMAKKLYKEAIRRTEHPIGCYNMLLSIYMNQYT